MFDLCEGHFRGRRVAEVRISGSDTAIKLNPGRQILQRADFVIQPHQRQNTAPLLRVAVVDFPRHLDQLVVTLQQRRLGTPARHRKNQTLSDFIANSRAWSLSDERSVNFKLDRNVSGSQKRQGLKLTGGIGPPHHLSMSGAIEADTERVLPRTGYIPTNEPTSLRAQGVTMGLEFHY